ncbi:MAG: bifunctional oligoribonuclease/PAP phosphatase NrnA [Armatimonadota bacterium]
MPSARARIAKIIQQRDSFLLTTHERPDGDALGAALALRHVLEDLGKQVEVVAGAEVPARYGFLPGMEEVRAEASGQPYEVLVGLDCDGAERMAVGQGAAEVAEVVVDIDHHSGNQPFGDVQWVEAGAAAVGQQIYQLLQHMEVAITPPVATCLYCAIATDTGFFRFGNTTAEVLEICAALVEAGADPHEIALRAHDEKPLSSVALLGRALQAVRSLADGRVVWAHLTPADFAAAGADGNETEGIVEYLKSVEGARAAALFRDEGRGEVRVSLRAGDGVDVAAVARKFGGGGHASAAGCTIPGDLGTATDLVLSELQAVLG